MKLQCDVCAAEAASVFCCADEAALCDACDRRVHSANKLAGKHRRFSLLSPTPPSSSGAAHQQPPPLCDICQEKRALLFCKEDRAILCRDCDVSVHTVSELTMRHTRFLLTGVRLSAEPAACPEPLWEDENTTTSSSFCCSAGNAAPPAPATSNVTDSSSISEYLTKTLPGWHVEDFLVDEATAAAAAASATTVGVSADDGSYHQVGAAIATHAVNVFDTLLRTPNPKKKHAACSDRVCIGGIMGAVKGVGLAGIGGMQHGYSTWMAQEQLLGAVAGDGRAHREWWVPQMYAGMADLAGSKRPRTTSAASYSYW